MEQSSSYRLKADALMPLTVRSDLAGVLRLIGHLAAVIVTAVVLWSLRETWWQLPLTLMLGALMAFLFNAEHEAAHQTAFRSRWLNTATGQLAGFIVMLPYHYYRAFHWDHHRYTQDPKRDPELAVALPTSKSGLLWVMTGLPSWRVRAHLLFAHAAGGRVSVPWVPSQQHRLIIGEARCYLTGYLLALAISAALHSWAALYLWVLPVMAGQFLLRPFLLAEHTGCAFSSDMLANTRTTYTNRLVRFFAWNMPYHTAHHAYPAVPFHKLPELNRLLEQHLKETAPSYRAATRMVLQSGERRRAELEKVSA
jgi:fatty acid desaturase